LAEIVQALDGPFTLPKQSRAASRRPHERLKFESILSPVWEKLRQAELDVLSGVSLQDLIEHYHELEQTRALMYHI